MIELRRICCGVDLSEPSRTAMLQAAVLAKRFGAELTLLHVTPAGPDVSTELHLPSDARRSVEVAEFERILAPFKREAEAAAERPVRVVVVNGDAAARILTFAQETHCDAVVVGTHGRGGLKRLVLGSVAEKVVRGAACTVVVARRAEDEGVIQSAEADLYR